MKQKAKFKQTEIGMIPEDWEVSKFSQKININPKRDLKKGTETKKVAMENLQPYNKKIQGFDIKKYSGGSKFINGDTLMARITPCLENGKTAFCDVLDKEQVGFGSTEFIILSGKKDKTINEFVYYFSISPLIRLEAIKSMTGTSGRQRVQVDLLGDIDIFIPPITEQHSISKILSDLDAKIELNHQMNKTLEAIGQAIFKHWFVDFEFPNEEGKPYKSSGGEMVYNEELGKEIPEGWEVKELKEFGNIVCGKTPPKSHKEYFGGDTPFIKIPDMHNQFFIINTEDSLTKEGRKYQENKTIPEKSICVSCIATVGLVSITTKESQSNQQINSIIPYESYFPYYLFFTLKSLKRDLENLGRGGSATLNINTTVFSDVKILKPDQEVVKSFDDIIKPLFMRILSNSLENQQLSQIRDSLLPKLMSGKIRIPVEVR